MGEYDFKGVNGAHRVNFEGDEARLMQNVKSVRFVVKSGVGNLTSCSEITFYGTANVGMEVIWGETLVPITSATTSSTQGSGVDIDKTYDRDFTSRYHSSWDNKGENYFPIRLDYNFDAADIKTIIYYTRMDDSKNGNFNQFELWALPANGASDYVKVGEYDFSGKPGQHRITFDGELSDKVLEIKGLRFVVNSGISNFASCAEMAFYAKPKDTNSHSSMDVNDKLHVVVHNRRVCVKGEIADQQVYLYSQMGKKININSSLNPGIYLVKVGESVSRILVQ